MMIFADVVSDFINKNPEIKLLALFFITAIGLLLVIEFFGVHHLAGVEIKMFVYFGMFFSLIVTLLQMAYKNALQKMHDEIEAHKDALESGCPEAQAKEAERLAAIDQAKEQEQQA